MNVKQILLGSLIGMAFIGSAQAADVKGFRSATFGADEKAVTAAIVKDLGVPASDIRKALDPVTQMTRLAVSLKSFAPLNLPAQVNYLLGYKCKCLVNTSIVWEVPEKATTEQRKTAIIALGALVSHFESQGWESGEVIKNGLPKEPKEGDESTIIFFRGQNKANSAITVLGAPVKMVRQGKAEALSADIDGIKNIILFYDKDANTPDIFKVDVGGF